MCYIISVAEYRPTFPERTLYKSRLSSFGTRQDPLLYPEHIAAVPLESLPQGVIALLEYLPDQRILHAVTLSWQQQHSWDQPRPRDFFGSSLDGVIGAATELAELTPDEMGLTHAVDTFCTVQSALRQLVVSGSEPTVTQARIEGDRWYRITDAPTPVLDDLDQMLMLPDWYSERVQHAHESADTVTRELLATASVESLVNSGSGHSG